MKYNKLTETTLKVMLVVLCIFKILHTYSNYQQAEKNIQLQASENTQQNKNTVVMSSWHVKPSNK